jgi:pimeloyl-ACP methyl ester carboxylesterase
MTGPRQGSGVTEAPDTLFFNFQNPVAARDNVLQGAADVFSLTSTLATLSLPGLPLAGDTTSFNPKEIYFIGHSQGSTVGLPASAFEPNLAGMVYSGAGADLRLSLVSKKSPVDIADLTPYILEDSAVDQTHPALNLFQAFFERADAENYGGLLLSSLPTGIAARSLVQTYGLGDTYAPIPTLQAMASAIGLNAAGSVPGSPPWPSAMGIALPVTGNVQTSSGTVTAALLEADPMGAYDGHFVLFDNPALQGEVMQFLGTAQSGTATIQQ